MTVKQLNILKTYHAANADELHEGLLWYGAAHEDADRLAEENGLTIQQTSAMIAACSPGLRWEKNVECAERIIKGESLKGLGVRWFDGVRKARKIKRGHNPDVVLKGNKVKAFYAGILNPSITTTVCIDGHAWCVWAGRRVSLDEVPTMNDRLYHRVASDYCLVARDVRLSPCQLQAVTWLAWRRLHGVTRNAIQE